MATSTTTRPASVAPKMQPPPPPRIRTSSVGPTSSSSPSMGTKRPPSLPRQHSSAGPNSAGRPQRNRKETQRLRSMSRLPQYGGTGGEDALEEPIQPPLIRHDDYILRKFKGMPPSLIVHFHQLYFRFDQQDGRFGYQSPLKPFLDHLRARTVPHDMLVELHLHNVPFYDGCLIIEIHDHRSASSITGDDANSKSDKTDEKAFSIHKSTHWVTPSPYRDHMPYPSPASTPQNSPPVNSERIKQEPSQARFSNTDNTRPQEKIYTCVLHPTQLSQYHDILIEATTAMPDSRNTSKKAQAAKESSTPMSAYPPTPSSSVAPTPIMSKGQPAKKQRMKIDDDNLHHFEAELLRRQEPTLLLDPAQDFVEVQDILRSMKHPLHDHEPPKHNGRKRTHAELEADEAAAAEEERIALICDPRFNPSLANAGTGASGPTEGHDSTNAGDMNFNRFKRIEDIHTRHKEEQHARAMDDGKREQLRKEQNEMQHREAMMQKAKQQKLNEEQMMKLRAENAATAAQNQTPQMHNAKLMQQQALQNLRLQQSGAQHSSPVMAPSGMGSSPNSHHPMLRGGGAPMSTNMPQSEFNSPRPGCAMNVQPNLAQPMARQISQQQSNASQSRTATPQLPNMTPQMGQNMPLHQTPQMQNHHGSPVNMQNGHTPVMPPNFNNAQQIALIQQQQQALKQRQQQQHQMRLAQNGAHLSQAPSGMMHMSPQQRATMQAHYMQQQQHQQQSQALQSSNMSGATANGHIINPEIYRQRLAAQMKAQQAQQAHQVQQAQQAQQAQAQQAHQTMPNAAPAATGMQYNPNMPVPTNMARHPSQQQFQQQSNMQTPHISQASPVQHQTPQQQPMPSQMNPVQQFQQMKSQHIQSQKREWMANLAHKNGGALPQNAAELFAQWGKREMAEAIYTKWPQMRRPPVQSMQGQDHVRGQNMNVTPNMNMMMRQNLASGQQPNQNQNFNSQMSPQGNMGMQTMQGHMQNNMQGHIQNNMQAMQGMNGTNMSPQQLQQFKIERMKQQQQQQAMAARAASGGMPINGHMQMTGMHGGQMPGQGQGQGRGGG